VPTDRSTLLTSPLSFADFAARLLFFGLAPFGIVFAAELFPVRGALLDVGLALAVFLSGEAARRAASRARGVKWLLAEALAFETYYRDRPPRPFAYYLFYPLLFPYWLTNAEARREFLMFRGYTVGSFVLLVVSLGFQYFEYWRPELGFRQFALSVFWTLLAETTLVLSFLMPIATTVVWCHSSFRRGRLLALLLVGLVSATAAFGIVARRRDPVVSFSTRNRVLLRTRTAPVDAHRTLLAAAAAAYREAAKGDGLDGDGKIEGAPLASARERLEDFYKHDEAYAFDLWGTPRKKPRIVVLYFEARRGKPGVWVGVRHDGTEVQKLADLPEGATRAMRRAADGTAPLLPEWPKEGPRANHDRNSGTR
jgi:hypothetical protein